MKIESSLAKLLRGKDLAEKEGRPLFRSLFKGRLKQSQAKALLLLLARKGETVEELGNCLRALRSLEKPYPVSIPHLMDTCGTGGDRSHSINVSTLAALVIAGAGGKVAKHGNRALSSRSGSSDLMEALGVRLEAPRKRMLESIRRYGIGFFHAPLYHPLFARMQPLRRELKTRTIFNLLGPLANPLKIEARLVGVSKLGQVALYANVLGKQGIRRALVCHSADGLDEISPAAPTLTAWVEGGRVRYETIHPKRYGFRPVSQKAFRASTVRKNRALALRLLQGKLRGPMRDLVVINSAAGLVLCGVARDLHMGIRLAEDSLDSGRAFRALHGLRSLSRTR